MRQNMVHFVASDAHDTEWRPPDLREARQLVSTEYGESTSPCDCSKPIRG